MEKRNQISKGKCLKVVLFGPESTGKSTLARKLAKHYNTNWVPEFARGYLQNKWDNYKQVCSIEDLQIIVDAQKSLEEKLIKDSNKLIFCDTNAIVTQIWSETHFDGFCPLKIKKAALESDHDFYLLTDIDIPWVIDDLRDRPYDRKKMIEIFKNKLDQYELKYKLISGNINNRMLTATKVIDNLIKKY
tara:strand:+ start:17279 stop:17845 length:567 start_codon:yes stop_codon:yes gene_type:complete